MKTRSLLIALVACLLGLVGCTKNPLEADHIVAYRIGSDAEQRAVVNTEAEWQALLERFCNYAEAGSTVSFRNANRTAQIRATKDAVEYSTTSREEMKAWMRQMEAAGRTVTISYDRETGTWHGIAYAVAPQPDLSCHTGVLTSAPNPRMGSEVPLPGMVWALRTETDSLLLISINGHWVFDNGSPLILDSAASPLHIGDTTTLCGQVAERVNADGQAFLELQLASYPNPVPADSSAICLVRQFKVDFLTHRLEGYHTNIIRGYRNLVDTLPISMQYCPPGDFGWVKLFYGPTGDTLFAGDIIWMGCGGISYPATYRTDFSVVQTFAAIPYPGLSKFYLVGDALNSAWDQYAHYVQNTTADSLCMALWNAVAYIDVFQPWTYESAYTSRIGVYLYQPSVGEGDPADWDYILFAEMEL